MKVLFAGPDPDLVMGNTGEARKDDLHLSDITKRMTFEKDKKLNPNSPIDAMVIERGYNWESILERALDSRHKRPGYRPEQMQAEEGYWMSPDWVNPDGDIQLEEWKATKKSSKRGFEDVSWHWLPNTMEYLRELLRRGIATVSAARFRIWWINGDYSYTDKSSDFHLLNEYWKVDVEFDKRDLDENHQKIVSNGQRYGLLKTTATELTRGAGTRGQMGGVQSADVPPSPVKEARWQKTPTTVKTKRPKSAAPAPSPAKARIVTFPSTKKSSRPRSGS